MSDTSSSPPRWETLSTTTRQETPIFTVDAVSRRHPDRTEPATFWVVAPSDWVNILAITPEGELVLVEQYRHGTDTVTIEIPGGAVDPDEPALEAAKRELEEETGYTSTRWIELGKIAVNPAMMRNHCTTFLVLDVARTAVQNLDEHEDIALTTLSIDAFFEAIDSGEIDHGIVVSAAHYLARYLARTP